MIFFCLTFVKASNATFVGSYKIHIDIYKNTMLTPKYYCPNLLKIHEYLVDISTFTYVNFKNLCGTEMSSRQIKQ